MSGSLHNRADRLLLWSLGAATAVSAVAVLAIFAFLAYFSLPVLTAEGAREVLSWNWRPFQGEFGILPMVVGSLVLASAAMAFAFPCAIFVCAFAYGAGPRRLAAPVMAVLHFMTGIPTIVYAFVAVVTIPPLLRRTFETGSGFSLLAAALALSILVLPTIVLVIDTNWRGLADGTSTTCSALGLNRTRAVFGVLVPISRQGLLGAFVLGFGRALGDTMIALVLSGNSPQIPASPLDSVRVLTAHVGMVMSTDVGSPAYDSVFASGLILLVITGALSSVVRHIAREGACHA